MPTFHTLIPQCTTNFLKSNSLAMLLISEACNFSLGMLAEDVSSNTIWKTSVGANNINSTFRISSLELFIGSFVDTALGFIGICGDLVFEDSTKFNAVALRVRVSLWSKSTIASLLSVSNRSGFNLLFNGSWRNRSLDSGFSRSSISYWSRDGGGNRAVCCWDLRNLLLNFTNNDVTRTARNRSSGIRRCCSTWLS